MASFLCIANILLYLSKKCLSILHRFLGSLISFAVCFASAFQLLLEQLYLSAHYIAAATGGQVALTLYRGGVGRGRGRPGRAAAEGLPPATGRRGDSDAPRARRIFTTRFFIVRAVVFPFLFFMFISPRS